VSRTKGYVHPMAGDAAKVLGLRIREGRLRRGWTTAELAQRVGVSPPTIVALEAGATGTAIGTIFTAAALTDVPLFGAEDAAEIARMRHLGEERIALLPKRVIRSHPSGPAGNDF
jgi:transcriptional regulator with XRE-family HTH domain